MRINFGKNRKCVHCGGIHAASILNEEAGKLTQACNDYKFGDGTSPNPYDRMNKKAVSTAAMALRFWHGMGAY